jgi:diguanylate cyclase (GGDEF)-like protein/PAS domain S-box-containing protein
MPLVMTAMIIWSGLYAARWMDISLQAKSLSSNLMVLGIMALPTLFLIFVLEFTGNGAWLTARRLGLLSVHPLVSLLLAWTNRYHHLYYLSVTTVHYSDFLIMDFIRGPWYFANVTYSYVMIATALILLGMGLGRSGPMYRQQYCLILLGAILPSASSIYSEYHFSELGGLDLAPLTFGFSGLIFVFAIRSVPFLDLIPVARSYVIENMRDGIVVLDTQNRIVDLNPAMKNFLEGRLSTYMGKNAFEIFGTWRADIDSFWEELETRAELKLPKDPGRYLDLRMTPLYDGNRFLNGRLIVFRDITERKQVEKRLRYVNDRLQSQLIEIGTLQSKLREQAIRDPLTNLFNRRYLEETLDRELARAARETYPLCIIMIDLDHFKKVNDSYGHEAGDHVLRALANALSEQSRRGDFACRYGGEEFVIVMPNISMATAYERAESLRNTLNSLRIPYEYYNLSVTISMGIACYPINGQSRDALLRAADQAMYAAKEAGRDNILSYDQLDVSENMLGD